MKCNKSPDGEHCWHRIYNHYYPEAFIYCCWCGKSKIDWNDDKVHGKYIDEYYRMSGNNEM